jgi:CRP-like cAMP-binding protein
LLAAVGTEFKWMFIPGGQILFRENEVADSLYIALIGCLSVMCGKTTAATFWLRDMLAISDRRR